MPLSPEEELAQILARARTRSNEFTSATAEEYGSAALEGAATGATVGALSVPLISAYERATRKTVGDRLTTPGLNLPVAPDPAGTGLKLQNRGVENARMPRLTGTARSKASKIVGGILEDVAQTFVRHPGKFMAAEVVGGAAAGAASETAEEGGAGPAGQFGAGAVAGAIATSPVALYNAARRFTTWGMENITPFLKGGYWLRAARQMQARAGADLGYREELADQVLSGREGVSAARRTGNEALLAQEARVLEDNPDLERQVGADLEAAITSAKGDLADLYGTPRGKEEWEKAVFERVSAPGTEITSDTTDGMLNQAYDSFETMYEPAKGFVVRPFSMRGSRQTPLRTMVGNVVNTKTSMASDDIRRQTARWLDGQYAGSISRRVNKDGTVDSADMLAYRSKIRRQAAKIRRTNPDGAELLDLAASKVTEVLSSQLPSDAMKALKAADAQYGMYKTVENAVYGAADKPFGPDALLAALKRGASSKGAYARGSQGDMRSLAMSGRSAEELIGKPEKAVATVRGMNDADRRNLRADFMATLSAKATKVDKDTGEEVFDGALFLAKLRQNTKVARALGMSHEEIGRADRIGTELARMQSASPAAVDRLMEQGPSSFLQMLAIVAALKRMPKIGPGQLIVSGFFAKRARVMLDTLTSGKASELLRKAHEPGNEELYAALLVKPTDTVAKQAEAARIMNSWLGISSAEGLGDEIDDLRDQTEQLVGE